MKISDCSLGIIVYMKDVNAQSKNYGKAEVCKKYRDKISERDLSPICEYEYIKMGHVVGFELNNYGETIVRVKWNDGQENSIHPANLLLNPNGDNDE